jgi:hypothetical protein
MYYCQHGKVTVLAAEGHRTTSPAVVRNVNQAIQRCIIECLKEQP